MPKETKIAQTQSASGFQGEMVKKTVEGNNSDISNYC